MIPIAMHARVEAELPTGRGLIRLVAIACLACLTVVDLFAAQALLPALVTTYGASSSAVGIAVNASTLGMAVGSIVMAFCGARLDRRAGIVASLALLAVPTLGLASAPDLVSFGAIRVCQGLCMACAFTLTLASLAQTAPQSATAAAFAAYITGNVASNLLGRLLATSLTEFAGLAASFRIFALLNLLGAVLAAAMISPSTAQQQHNKPVALSGDQLRLLEDDRLLAVFGIGFCILFAFVGTFTYVNVELVRPPLALGMMSIGLVYFVFLPSIATTPFAGTLARRMGPRTAITAGLGIAVLGLVGLLQSNLVWVLGGLTLVGIGTFFAQAAATGFVGRVASRRPGLAAGLYLAAYFSGGLTGSVVLGAVYAWLGWAATVACVGVALLAAAGLAQRLGSPDTARSPSG